jgi:hypothetical protein
MLAILAETRRVLRDDGTLWLFTAPAEMYLEDLREEGWRLQATPVWARRLAAYGRPALGLFLLSKQSWYFYDTNTICVHPAAPSLCVNGSCRVRRAQSCVPVREHERGLRLVKRCVMAGSSLLACGECGAPYRRARPGESARGLRHPTCSHNNPDGRCLVLDPFYRPGLPSAEAVLCSGRSFLGLTDTSASEGR